MYSNLIGLMRDKNISKVAMAKLLGCHENTVANKLNGDSEFTFGEAELIYDNMFSEYSFRYVFKREPRIA